MSDINDLAIEKKVCPLRIALCPADRRHEFSSPGLSSSKTMVREDAISLSRLQIEGKVPLKSFALFGGLYAATVSIIANSYRQPLAFDPKMHMICFLSPELVQDHQRYFLGSGLRRTRVEPHPSLRPVA